MSACVCVFPFVYLCFYVIVCSLFPAVGALHVPCPPPSYIAVTVTTIITALPLLLSPLPLPSRGHALLALLPFPVFFLPRAKCVVLLCPLVRPSHLTMPEVALRSVTEACSVTLCLLPETLSHSHVYRDSVARVFRIPTDGSGTKHIYQRRSYSVIRPRGQAVPRGGTAGRYCGTSCVCRDFVARVFRIPTDGSGKSHIYQSRRYSFII